MIEIKISGINLELLKRLQEQNTNSEDLIEIKTVPRQNPIKDPTRPNRITFNDSYGAYEIALLISEYSKDVFYNVFVGLIVQQILEGKISPKFKIGKSPVLQELEKLSLETLCEEEQLKKAEIRLKRLLIEEEIKKIEESKKEV